MKARDWTLLAINAAEGKPLSPVQLQKSLFVLGRQLPNEVGSDFYQFRPYDYGPFCSDIYRDAEFLEQAGLVKGVPGHRWVEYAITPSGAEAAAGIETRAPRRATQHLRDIVTWARKLTFSALIRAVYQKYPEFREHSVFRG